MKTSKNSIQHNSPRNKEEILQFLRKNKKYLKKEFGITKIGLFGSFARDEQGPESDIDLIVDTSIMTFRNYVDMKDFFEKQFHKKIDLGLIKGMKTNIRLFIEEEAIYA